MDRNLVRAIYRTSFVDGYPFFTDFILRSEDNLLQAEGYSHENTGIDRKNHYVRD